jgi:membrane protein
VRLTRKTLPRLLQRTLFAAIDDGVFSIAKGAAFSALLAFFPVLTSAATIMITAKADFVARTVSQFLFEVVPPGTEDVVRYQFTIKGQRPALLLIIAVLFSLWGASGVIRSLLQGFRNAYRIAESRSIFHEIAVSISLVILAIIPLVGGSALILFGVRVDRTVMGWLKVDPIWTPLAGVWQDLAKLARYGVAFGVMTTFTAMLYYFGPYRRQCWANVWPGAGLATVLWLLATGGFGWYVRNMANYNVLYGSVGTSIALLVWMYLMSLIALLGCEFNAEYERMVQPTASKVL